MKSPDAPPSTPRERKPYTKPVVRAYGTIRALTRNAGTMGPTSDGSGMTSKTS